MKSQDLRINNWVLDRGLEQTVDSICNTESGEADCCLSHSGNGTTTMHPIPLTNDWLMKFGFEEWDRYNWKNNGVHIHFIPALDEFEFQFGGSCVTIQYAHQLQNLYFSLTQKELTP